MDGCQTTEAPNIGFLLGDLTGSSERLVATPDCSSASIGVVLAVKCGGEGAWASDTPLILRASSFKLMFLHDQETAVDLLYYEPIARTVTRLIRDADGKALTIGVHGDWGAGKSSVLKMVEAAFTGPWVKKGESKTVCVWFNGWAFEGYDDAKAVVIETIVDELRRQRPFNVKVAEAAMKVLRRVDWLKVAKRASGIALNLATGLPSPGQVETVLSAAKAFLAKQSASVTGEDIEGFVDKANEYVKEKSDAENTVPAQIHAFRQAFEELLKTAEVDQLVVLVDDLDRCLPTTAIATLEAIRLFLFVPRTAFVIGADEAMIEYAVKDHFPDLPASSGPAGYARNYLEKLIQVPFRIPALGAAETRTYVTLLLAQGEFGETDETFLKLMAAARDTLRRPWDGEVLDRAVAEKALGKLPTNLDEVLRLSAQISNALTEGTRGNPRQIKRFLNSLALRIAVAEDRGFGDLIERPVLAKLMLAERFAADVFDQVAHDAANDANGHSTLAATWEVRAKEASPGRAQPPGKAVDVKAAGERSSAPAESDWALEWAAIEPPLTGKDLRPYVFVSRDKRGYFGALAGASHLQELLARLEGNRMAAAGAAAEVGKLGGLDAEKLFDALRGKVLEAGDLMKEPQGVAGLATLVKGQPALQPRLLAFFSDLPPAKVGAWVATQWSGCFDATHKAKFDRQAAIWAEEGSTQLKAVATTIAKMK